MLGRVAHHDDVRADGTRVSKRQRPNVGLSRFGAFIDDAVENRERDAFVADQIDQDRSGRVCASGSRRSGPARSVR